MKTLYRPAQYRYKANALCSGQKCSFLANPRFFHTIGETGGGIEGGEYEGCIVFVSVRIFGDLAGAHALVPPACNNQVAIP